MTDQQRFAHASEAELARILDYYGVRWEYEPRTFPILWNLDGKVVESFSPDFYLPEVDVYIELTTLRQSLVRRKNRKLRRVRELYPDIRVKLFYGKDFRALMLKYGRSGVAASLSGLEGQLVVDRIDRVDAPIAAQSIDGSQALEASVSIASSAPAAEEPASGRPAGRAAGDAVARGPLAALRRRLSRGSRRRRGRRDFSAADGREPRT